MLNSVKKGLILAGVLSGTVVNAAQVYGQDVTLDTTNLTTIMGAVVVGLAVIWGMRKVIKLMNRS